MQELLGSELLGCRSPVLELDLLDFALESTALGPPDS